MSELIEQWHSLYGQTLADPKHLMSKLTIICNGLGDPAASVLTAGDFTKYREARLKGELRHEDGALMSPIKPRTVNLEQRNLFSVFGTLKNSGHWSALNPLTGLPTFKIAQGELAFLTLDEIKRLLNACADSQSPSLLMVAKVCLTTRARWSGADNLEGHQLTKYRSTYTKSKSNRIAPISQELYDELPKNRGNLFTPCRKAFERTVNEPILYYLKAHVLRYTFASHFMMNDGNLLVFKIY